jgi:hypothetical protein
VARLSIIALLAACFPVVNCGGYYFVGFVSNLGGTTTVTGMVTAVSGGFVSDPTGITPVTAVTFTTSGSKITIHFCGDQQELFPINKTVRADYTAGISCSMLLKVVIVNEPRISRWFVDREARWSINVPIRPARSHSTILVEEGFLCLSQATGVLLTPSRESTTFGSANVVLLL